MLKHVLCLVLGIILCISSHGHRESALEQEMQKVTSPEVQKAVSQSKTECEKQSLLWAHHMVSTRMGIDPAYGTEDDFSKTVMTYGKFFNLVMTSSEEKEGEQVLHYQGEALRRLNALGCYELAETYVASLQELRARGGEEAALLSRDSAAVGVFQCLSGSQSGDRDLWKFYVQENCWVSEIVARAGFQALYAEDVSGIQSHLREGLLSLKRYAPSARRFYDELCQQAVPAEHDEESETLEADVYEQTLSIAMDIFKLHGSVLEACYQGGCSPLAVYQILMHNESYVRELRARNEERLVRRLITLNHGDVELWEAAQHSPRSLSLLELDPKDAPQALKKYGTANLGAYLYLYFDDRVEYIVPILKALNRYGDFAFSTLQYYAEDKNFCKWLKHPDVGERIFPMMFTQGYDKTLKKLEDDLDWVKRYVMPDGSIRKEEMTFLEAMPFIGGIATVSKHWCNGEPCEWGEIGWAALDVADIALVVATLGSSSAVTVPLKGGGKQVVTVPVKKAAKSTAKALAKKAVRQTFKSKLMRISSKIVSSSSKGKALCRSLVHCMKMLRVVGKLSVKAVKVTLISVYHGWRKLPVSIRKVVLGTGTTLIFMYTVSRRTLPYLQEHGMEKLTGFIGSIVERQLSKFEDYKTLRELARTYGIVPWRLCMMILGILLIIYGLSPCIRFLFRLKRRRVRSI